jgi:hypothetical protein
MSLGFESNICETALKAFNGEFSLAKEWLLSMGNPTGKK